MNPININTNYSSLVARGNLASVNNDISVSMNRLSSGLRINSASDDSAGLAISERMTAQIRGLDQSYRNVQDGISFFQTTESSLGTFSDMLQRIRELSIQADNGTNSSKDLDSIQGEIDQLIDEMTHLVENSDFNGINTLDGLHNFGMMNLHISDKADDKMDIFLHQAQPEVLYVNAFFDGNWPLDIKTPGSAKDVIKYTDEAINYVSEKRGYYGSVINRLNFIADNITNSKNNILASRSRISDTDMAAEMSTLTKNQVLQQTTLTMLSRANSQPQSILSLLQG